MDGPNPLDELAHRRGLAKQMGGAEKVAKHRSRGKIDVRTRIDMLCDPGTFREIGTLSGAASYNEDGSLKEISPANFIYGRGKVGGRDVVIAADDNTVRGGAADASIREKVIQSERMANTLRLPMIRLIDATGGSVRTVEAMGRTYVPGSPAWGPIVSNLETVPVVSLVLGSVAGIASARAVASHLTVMVRDTSHMFIGGPPVVARLGIETTKDSLGGYQVHEKSGAVDMVVDSEEAAFDAARRFLSYLPSSVGEQLPRGEPCELAPDPSLRDIVPKDRRKVYKMREIVKRVVDPDSFMEVAPKYGRAQIHGLARIDGYTVAIMASDPMIYGGGWGADTCDKIARFLDFCETFRIPVVNFVDCPGFVIGPEAERTGTIRRGARAMSAIYRSTLPVMAILIRKVFGVAGAAHQNHEGHRDRIAWPSGDWGSIPLEGGIEAAYASELNAAEDREATLAGIVARLDALRSPFRTAEAFGVEEIVDPAETREWVVDYVRHAYRRNMRDPSAVRYRP